jgi:two-component system cell cycle response regulator
VGTQRIAGIWTTVAPTPDTRPAPDGPAVETLLARVGGAPRDLVAAATQAVLRRFGDRGSCILVDDRARVVFSTEQPELYDLPINIDRYPEIGAAVRRREVVVVEDVRTSSLLEPVASHLPPHLGAVAAVPLVSGDRCLGVILVQSARRRAMAPDDIRAAAIEARLAGTLLALQFGGDLMADLRRLGAPSLEPAPRPPTGQASMMLAPTEFSRAQLARGRILIGEDDREQALALRSILLDEDYDVALAGDGAQVVRLAQRLRPDLLLLDLHMPVLDGFDALEELVADPRTCDMPIVIVSGADDLLPRMRGLKLDTVDFLRKPFSLLELLARIDRSLQQASARSSLRQEASIDDLTGLGNARHLRERLALEQSRIARYGTHSAIVMVDVDKLKVINDEHGHVVGSRVLKAIGEILRSQIRETDLAARYGGDEFVVLLPHTTSAEACAFAERVLACLRRSQPEGVDVSLSLGVAAVEGSGGQSIELVFAQADAAAYRAKRSGGGRVCIFDRTIDPVVTGRQDRQEVRQEDRQDDDQKTPDLTRIDSADG